MSPIIEVLVRRVDVLDEDAREFFEERAGILEYEAGMPQGSAETLALDETLKYLARRSTAVSRGR